MTLWFVVNPRAGRADQEPWLHHARQVFADRDVRIVGVAPSRERIADAGPDARVIAVGGDGTVQHVLQSLGTPLPCPVGILPAGTSNDLATAAGIPADPAAACRILAGGEVRRRDLITVNGIPFATAGGIGLPAAIAARASRWRTGTGFGAKLARLLGRTVYVAAALVELVRGRRTVVAHLQPATGRAPGRLFSEWSVVLFSNGPATGGFRATPDADGHDGQFDLFTIAAPGGRLRLGWVVLMTRLGRAARCCEVALDRARIMTLETRGPVPFYGDGEILLQARRFDIRILPGALPLVTGGS